MEHLEAANGYGSSLAALTGQLVDFGISERSAQQFRKTGRHSYGSIEPFHGLYTPQGSSLCIGIVVRHAHHVHRKANETRHILIHHITSP